MPPLFLERAHAAAIGLGRIADQGHRPAILLRIGKAGEAVQDGGAGPAVGPLPVAQRLFALADDRLTRACRRAGLLPDPLADQAQLSGGVQNRTALADIAVKCSEKTARGLTIAAESFAFWPRRQRNNSKNSG
jgi:hypothetical protein